MLRRLDRSTAIGTFSLPHSASLLQWHARLSHPILCSTAVQVRCLRTPSSCFRHQLRSAHSKYPNSGIFAFQSTCSALVNQHSTRSLSSLSGDTTVELPKGQNAPGQPSTDQNCVGSSSSRSSFESSATLPLTEEVSAPGTPPPAPDVQALAKHYTPWHSSMSDYTALSRICLAPYHVPVSVCRTLQLLGHVHTTLEQGSKHLLLAAAHPGSTLLLSEAVHSMGLDIGADVQSLDYQTILEASRELGVRQVSWGSDECLRRFEKPELLKLSQSFTPAHYDTALFGEEADPEDEEAEFDEDEDDDDHDPPSRGDISTGSIFSHSSFSDADSARSSPSRLILKVNFVQDDAGKAPVQTAQSGLDSAGKVLLADAADDTDGPSFRLGSPALRITNVSIQPDSTENGSAGFNNSYLHGNQNGLALTHRFPLKETHYDLRLSNNQIQAFLGTMRDSIIKRFQAYSSDPAFKDRKLIIFLKDTTDILESGSVDGRKILLGIMDLTLSLRRDHKIPALFVAACSPALAHTPNVEKDAAFYSSLFEGTATLMNQDGDTVHNHIWKNGKLYETSLDCAGKEFEKLEFVPPCPMGISLEATNFKTGRTTGSEKGAPQGISPPIEPHKSSLPSNDSHTTATDEEMLQGLQHISSHVDSLQEDLRIRLRQINWRNTEMVCARRGIIVRDVDSSHVSDPSTNSLGTQTSSADLHALLVTLEVGIWPISRVEKLVNLAIGCRIEHGIRNNIPASHTSELSGMHILEALQVLQQSERVRLNRENTLNSLKDGSSAKKGHRFDHNLTYTGADSSSGKHRPEGHSSASESAPKQEQSDSAQLQEMLRAQGHRINAYEKKILSTVVNPDNIKVGFSDLVLPPTTKLLLQTLVTLPMLRPEFFAKGILSRSAINGVLLFGPPGTGKTMLAKAVAKSSGARFMNVALSNVLDKYVGEGEKNVRAVFTLARKLAPCVVFLDEVDALFAARRNDGSNSSRREIMNEFMAEWDGLTSNNNGVIVLGATNRPFDLDDAILRRMPRRILIDLPNEEARAVILKGLLVDELMDSSIDISLLAKKSALYSGSDLKSLCISAALARVKESIVRSLLQGDDKTAVSSDHVAAHLDRLDDWVKCLKPQSAQSSGPTGDNSAASVKFGASTSGRRHRSSNLPHTIGASAEPLKSSPSADSPESDLTSSSSTTSAAKVEVSSEDSSKKEGKPEPEMPGVVYDHNTEPLTSAHFDIAFTEVPPSLTDEMQTLIELRKWDGQFGDGAARRNAKKTRGWGFDFVDTGSRTTSSASGIQ